MPIVTGRTPGPGTAGQRSAAPEEQAPVWIDALVLGVVIALFGGLVALGRQWSRPFDSNPQIDLSLAALPRYSLLTLSRGFAAYFCSLAFTLAYGAAAAHNRRAEKILIPVLDILQGIPVLAFLPGLITGLVAIFPGSNTGLELACILAIFTGQAWNMTFSFYSSVKAIPSELIEVARLHRFGFWRRFLQLEVPASMIGLLWNSMMSMAGGWFFLTIVETVRFKNRDYRLPGVGSYMLEALHEKNAAAMVAACLAMVAIIVFLDQLFWRPLIAWSQKFKLEDTEAAERPTSWAYDLVRRSRLVAWLKETVKRPRFGSRATAPEVEAEGAIGVREATERAEKVANAIGAAIAAALAVLTAVGAWHLVLMLAQLTAADWGELLVALACTTARVLSIMAISLAWALPAGIAIGKSPRLSRVLQPVIQVVASFPIPMLFPLIGLGIVASGVPFGIGCTLLMLLGSQWYILFNVVAGAMALPQDLREVAAVYGMRRLARFRILYVSGIFPYLVTGLITAAGGAWNASIVAEFVAVPGGPPLIARGIGSSMWVAFDEGRFHILAAGVLVLSVLLVMLNRFVWKPLYRLADERYSLNR